MKLIFFLYASICFAAATSSELRQMERAQKIERLENKLLAPCCYRQPVVNHISPEATRMRGEIVKLVDSGRTERQVIDLYKLRYGMRILGEPEGSIWWVATLVPTLLVLMALLILIQFLRKSSFRLKESNS